MCPCDGVPQAHRAVLLGTMAGGTVIRCCVGGATILLTKDVTATNPPGHHVFWIILLLMVLSEGVCSPYISLVDSSVLSMLGKERRDLYGAQRLWGAVGWGISAVGAGYAIQLWGISWMFVRFPTMWCVP